jgi:hypothetical protein
MSAINVIQSGHPFSMKWNSIRQEAGGMSIAKAITEGIDNDIDANATETYIKSWKDPMSLTAYLLTFNNGNGLDDLPHLFGLGEKILKKAETKIGNYNHGHAATVGYFNPTSYHAYSKTSSSAPKLLNFQVQDFDNDVAALSRGGGNSDYRAVDHTKYMSVSNSVTDINFTLSHIAKKTQDSNMKVFLQQIISGTAPHFLVNLYTFKKGHRFYKESVDNELVNTFPSLSLTYNQPLSKGYKIVTEVSSTDEKKVGYIVKKADKSTIISPICSRETYPSITFLCKMFSSENEDYIHSHVQLENGESKDLYLTDKVDDGRKTVNTMFPTTVFREDWNSSAFKFEGDFRLDINCPSEAIFKAFSNSLGTDLKGVDNTRGIYTRYMDRGGGKPFWMPGGVNNGGWPAARNSGHIGALLQSDDKRFIEKYLGLQSNKHNTDLSSSHALIKRFLTLVMTSIIAKYTGQGLATNTSGVKKWVLSDVCDMLMEKKKTKTPTPPVPVTPSTASSAGVTASESTDNISETPAAVGEITIPSRRSVTPPAVPMPPLSASVVLQHIRTQPQSEKSYLNFIKALITNNTVEEIDVMIENASERTMDGYAEKCRAIKSIQDYLDSKKSR